MFAGGEEEEGDYGGLKYGADSFYVITVFSSYFYFSLLCSTKFFFVVFVVVVVDVVVCILFVDIYRCTIFFMVAHAKFQSFKLKIKFKKKKNIQN